MSEPSGSVYVELEVSGRWAVSVLVEGWTDDEKAALLRGDSEARSALIDECERRVLKSPDDAETTIAEINLAPATDESQGRGKDDA